MKNIIYYFIFIFIILSSCENNFENESTLSTDIRTLQERLADEKEQLENQKQQLETLKRQQAQENFNIGYSYPTQVTTDNNQIQNLIDILNSLRSSENDINQKTAALIREQSSALQLARDQLYPTISTLEQNILQTQEQIYTWTNNIFPLNEQQKLLLQDLLNTLAEQKNQRDILIERRLELSTNALKQIQYINAASQQQKEDLIEYQNEVQSEIYSLREKCAHTFRFLRLNPE